MVEEALTQKKSPNDSKTKVLPKKDVAKNLLEEFEAEGSFEPITQPKRNCQEHAQPHDKSARGARPTEQASRKNPKKNIEGEHKREPQPKDRN